MGAFPEWIRSLDQPNYRRFFLGQAISMAGTFIQMGAIPWVVWELAHSAWWLGAANFLSQIPFLCLGLIGGAVADRFRRRPLIALTQSAAFLQAALLAALALTGGLRLGNVAALVVIGGIINAMDFPARQTFVLDLVGPADLRNAIALNASLVHLMRIAGPVLAGLLLLHSGAGICFTLNAVSYGAILVALTRMDANALRPQQAEAQHLACALREGFRIVRTMPELRRPLLLVACVALAGGNYLAFLPYFADRIFHRGPDLLGYLMGTSACGALVGALILARARAPRLERWLIAAGAGLAGGLLLFARTRHLPTALAGLFLVGMGFVILVSGTNTLVQLRAPPAARGRIVSYLTTAFFGLTPVGSLIAGAVATRIGVPMALTLGACACLAMTLWYARATTPPS